MSRSQRRPAHRITATAATLVLAAVAPATAQTQFPAVLAGHAILPAADASCARRATRPTACSISGKYTTPDGGAGTHAGSDARHLLAVRQGGAAPDRHSLPFKGQPVQGLSGIKTMKDGTFWVLTDNGFGSKAQLARRDADVPPREARLEGRHGRAGCDRVPARSRPQGAVPHRQRGHCPSAT